MLERLPDPATRPDPNRNRLVPWSSLGCNTQHPRRPSLRRLAPRRPPGAKGPDPRSRPSGPVEPSRRTRGAPIAHRSPALDARVPRPARARPRKTNPSAGEKQTHSPPVAWTKQTHLAPAAWTKQTHLVPAVWTKQTHFGRPRFPERTRGGRRISLCARRNRCPWRRVSRRTGPIPEAHRSAPRPPDRPCKRARPLPKPNPDSVPRRSRIPWRNEPNPGRSEPIARRETNPTRRAGPPRPGADPVPGGPAVGRTPVGARRADRGPSDSD